MSGSGVLCAPCHVCETQCAVVGEARKTEAYRSTLVLVLCYETCPVEVVEGVALTVFRSIDIDCRELLPGVSVEELNDDLCVAYLLRVLRHLALNDVYLKRIVVAAVVWHGDDVAVLEQQSTFYAVSRLLEELGLLAALRLVTPALRQLAAGLHRSEVLEECLFFCLAFLHVVKEREQIVGSAVHSIPVSSETVCLESAYACRCWGSERSRSAYLHVVDEHFV